VGIATSALLLGEGLPFWKLLAAGLVMAGLALNLLWPLLHRTMQREAAT
jgi:O-acetylserine/cysteine efflux transporter